jgi:uncharacterized protein YutE (UPF0331/DUF86 family)
MVDENSILLRIDHLKSYLDFLKEIKTKNEEEYLTNPYIYGSSERFLHLALECVINIGNHLVADLRLRKPQDNKDIFIILHEEEIISSSLKQKLVKMAGFRNLLVHGYTTINRKLIYGIIQNNLDDFVEFVKQIANYLD